jgi:AcrR family transcriptional regulator
MATKEPGSRSSDTTRRIMDATLDLIARDGLRAVTHRSVAAEADVATGLITYHFGSVEQLIRTVCESVIDSQTRRLEKLRIKVERSRLSEEEMVDLLSRHVARLLRPRVHREAVVGYELSIEIARGRADIGTVVAWDDEASRLCRGIVAAIGRPAADADAFVALLEGLSYLQTVNRDPSYVDRVVRPSLRLFIAGTTQRSDSSRLQSI